MTAPERIYMKPNDMYENGWARPIDTDQFDEEATEYIRADLASVPAQVKVKPLVWDRDGRRLHLDDTMQMSLGYDWDGYSLMRQEAYGLGCSYIIWPDHIGAKTWNLYGVADGIYVQNIAGEEAAKAAAQADYEARILAAIEPQPDPRDEHFDDYAVRSFAKMMAAKMAASRAKGRGGWSDPAQCSVEYLRQLLYAHLDKGDPVDVANICMMLRHYEASTAHEYESSAMAAACASRDKVIARMVEALTNLRDLMCESFEDDDGNLGCGQCENDCTGCIAHAALAAAKAVQHG